MKNKLIALSAMLCLVVTGFAGNTPPSTVVHAGEGNFVMVDNDATFYLNAAKRRLPEGYKPVLLTCRLLYPRWHCNLQGFDIKARQDRARELARDPKNLSGKGLRELAKLGCIKVAYEEAVRRLGGGSREEFEEWVNS